MLLFYAPQIVGNIHTLSVEESKHCLKSLRLKQGDELFLTDGKGFIYRTCIVSTDISACKVEIVETIKKPSLPYFLHIAVSPTKNMDRLEWFVEKAVEMGISEISAMVCEHSQRVSVKIDRMHRLMIAAMKQSLRSYLPTFSTTTFSELISRYKDSNVVKLIAYCGQISTNPTLLSQAVKQGKEIVLLIGPEGDFSSKEVGEALLAGFKPVSMGSMRLRTETAALMACSAASLAYME